jgi:hypothetical protein
LKFDLLAQPCFVQLAVPERRNHRGKCASKHVNILYFATDEHR